MSKDALRISKYNNEFSKKCRHGVKTPTGIFSLYLLIFSLSLG